MNRQVFAKGVLYNAKRITSLSGKRLNESRGHVSKLGMTNNFNYSDYYANPQYYDDPSDQFANVHADLNNNFTHQFAAPFHAVNLAASYDDLVYDYSKQSNLTGLPVNSYHENYADSLNHHPLSSASSSQRVYAQSATAFNQANQNSKRLFHRNSVIRSSSINNQHNSNDVERSASTRRPIDQIVDLNPNRSLFRVNLSPDHSPSINSLWHSSERAIMNANSSSNLSPDRPHSLVKRSSIISSSNETNRLPKMKPIYKNGRYANPFDSWQDVTALNIIKFLFSSSNLNLPKNRKDLDITLPVVKPIVNRTLPEDKKARVSWIGHATALVQFEKATILTDPHFSMHSHPFKWGIKRYRPAPITVDELPGSVNIICISHNHYDHLDYDSVMQLHNRFKSQLNWFVPLGMKAWFTNLDIQNVTEMNWWDEHQISDLDDIKVVATPSQHWSRRGAFDENKELWASYAIIGKNFRFYFGGDTGYNDKLFKTIGQEYGPFDFACIPIGAYEPNAFLKFQHVNPKEAVYIHKDIKSKLSMAIHWGTFPLSNEPYLDPPIKLRTACDEENVPKDKFLAFEHGETRLVNEDGTSKRENTNRYAK